MDALQCLITRRSVRKYLEKDVSEDMIFSLLDAAVHAPSSKNTQPWSFVVVRDREIIRRLGSISTRYNDYKHLSGAQVIIVVCTTKLDREEMGMDHILSACAATQNLLLAAHALGLGCCWTFCKSEKKEPEATVKKILNIPEMVDVLCLLPVGYPDPQYQPKKKPQTELSSLVHLNHW